jgi:NAD(P)-dependent dehydrogenase (short-subunit alcohol dehydrogenase family)
VAHGLAAEGAHVVVAARQVERAQEAAAEVAAKHGTRTLAVGVDVATAEGCDRLIAETIKAFGGADILINNAGTGSNETIREAPDDKWQYYWDLHVMAAVRLGRGFAPSMIERGGGVILHNASICATQPLWYEPIYNTTKAALVMFSKNLANELIPHNVRVNAINLGLTLTPDWVKTATQLTEGTDRTWKDYIQGIADEWAPIKRFASPEEVADFFVFLCSSRASYSVGTTYYVDGGMTKCIV